MSLQNVNLVIKNLKLDQTEIQIPFVKMKPKSFKAFLASHK